MADKVRTEINNGLDRWDSFWSEYMVWSLRFACYSANEYFFLSIRHSLEFITSQLIATLCIFTYSICTLWCIEKFFAKRFNPEYKHLKMTHAEKSYRVERERIIYSCFIYSLANCAIGFITAINFFTEKETFTLFALGFSGMILSLLSVPVGIICMTARNMSTGRRMPYLFPLGIAGFLVPTLFVLLTIHNLFIV